MGIIPPLHLIVSDKTGDAAIIEYVAGKLNIYDNKVNVITNSPVYEWHTENIRNFIALKPENNPAIKINGYEIAQFGQGSGLIGLPGDFSSPSRFVRAAYLVSSAFQGKNVDEGVGVAFHIMNHFDIPLGAVRGMEGSTPVYDTAQWTSAADLTNGRYFYHTYTDRTVRMIDLNKLDLNAPNIKTIGLKEIQRPSTIEDVSDQLK
jgi:choloylglycine hydrolase